MPRRRNDAPPDEGLVTALSEAAGATTAVGALERLIEWEREVRGSITGFDFNPPVAEAETVDEDEDEVFTCESCDAECSELFHFEGIGRCEECHSYATFNCDHCGNEADSDDSVATASCDNICPSCYDDYYFTCDSCCEIYRSATQYGGDGYCNGCYEEPEEDEDEDNGCDCADCTDARQARGSGGRVIKNYDYDVTRILDADKGRRLFGVELEVATQGSVHDTANHTHALVSKDAILKSDSSIATEGYDGFEIVTRPMTLANHHKFWNEFLDKCDRSLRSYDVGTCGLHIHVTRKSLSPLTIGKLLVFLNNPLHEQFIRRIAQRYNSGYSKAKDKTLKDWRYNNDRYEFLNLQNSRTVEFRLFRGTLNRQRLLACLEFVDTVIRFCEASSMQVLTVEHYKNFLVKDPKNKNLKGLLSLTVNEDAIENQ